MAALGRKIAPDRRVIRRMSTHCCHPRQCDKLLDSQIAVALIAFLLLRMAQDTQTAVASPLLFAHLVRLNLMHRRNIKTLLKPSTQPSPNNPQLLLCEASRVPDTSGLGPGMTMERLSAMVS